MNILKEYPPNYEKIKEVLNPPESACFAYGEVIYNPSGNNIFNDLMVHEMVHARQQSELGVEVWWDKYLEDAEFRKWQEVEAYAVQYNFVNSRRSSKVSKRYLEMFADHLSSIYKLEIDQKKALTLIRLSAKKLLDTKKEEDVV